MTMMSHVDERGTPLSYNDLVERFSEVYGASETDVRAYVDQLCGDFPLQWEVVAFADVGQGDWQMALDAGAMEWDL